MTTSVVVSTTEALTLVHNFIRTGRKIGAEPCGEEQVRLTVEGPDGEHLHTLLERARGAYLRTRERLQRHAA